MFNYSHCPPRNPDENVAGYLHPQSAERLCFIGDVDRWGGRVTLRTFPQTCGPRLTQTVFYFFRFPSFLVRPTNHEEKTRNRERVKTKRRRMLIRTCPRSARLTELNDGAGPRLL